MKHPILMRSIIMLILVAIAFTSIVYCSKVATSPEIHAETLQSLDEKKRTVLELTAATATTSTLIAAIPSDVTSPLANQIVELSEYLLIVVGVIFFEKVLLTLTGYVSFTFLIPVACLLYGLSLYVKPHTLKLIANKLVLFALVSAMVVPVSVRVSDWIEDYYEPTINQTLEDTQVLESELQENTEEETEEGFLGGLFSSGKDFITDIGDNVSELVEKCEQILSNFIDAVAVLLITSCAIPVVVVLFMVWITKMIFGINIPIKKDDFPKRR